MNKNQILIQQKKDDQGQDVYAFYILKTVSWAEERGLNSWISGHEVKKFALLSGKRYEVSPNCDIFLLIRPNKLLELCLDNKEVGQTYQFYKLFQMPDWWVGEIGEEDLNLLIDNDFSHTVSLSHRNADNFKKAYSIYLENHV